MEIILQKKILLTTWTCVTILHRPMYNGLRPKNPQKINKARSQLCWHSLMDSNHQKPVRIYKVSSPDSPEFTHLTRALTRSNLIAFDAEWKPIRSHQPNFPIVSLLQLACQFDRRLCSDSDELNESAAFLLDLSSIPLSSIWKLLKEVFVSPDVLKLGFKFKQDLIYLSSTFCLQGCEPGFDRVSFELLITVSFSLIYLFFLGGK